MKVYSHRGESEFAPENTMSAFYLADIINCDGIETDIRKTKDDVLVLIHDKTIDRTSNEMGKVSELTYNELLKYDFGNNKYKGEKIVKLDDFLKYFSEKKKYILLEIKERGYEDKIVEIIKKYNNKYITAMSFKYDVLKKIRELDNNINLGWLIYDLNDKVLQECKDINLNQILATSVCLEEKEVKIIHDNKFIVTAWGVLNKSDIKRLKNIGVDRIIYNSSYVAKKTLKENKYE
jgi:glycerophosphoryl diester phosphodiesterase